MRVLIVGGVAGGASCAARLRRLDETAEIHIYDRGSFVSFANCGLPYHVGDVIPEESSLVVATPQLFEGHFNIHVHTKHEVLRCSASPCAVGAHTWGGYCLTPAPPWPSGHSHRPRQADADGDEPGDGQGAPRAL